MLTECPSCKTVFRVTGAILKMGHGQVRCGKCRTQFDALESLLDDDEAETPTPKSAPAAQPNEADDGEDAIEARPPDMAEEITMEGTRIEISGTYRVPSINDADSESPQIVHEHFVIDREQPGEVEPDDSETESEEIVTEIDLQGDDGEPVAVAARNLMDDTADEYADRQNTAEARSDAQSSVLPLSQRIWQKARAKSQRHAEHREIAAELDALSRAETPATPQRKFWLVASVLLVVTLIAQMVHHNRDPLVRHPKWGDAISRVYNALGLKLTPNWDVRAYELQVWDVRLDTGEKDSLRVRASVTNTATFAQPYPLLKLALEDRWGMPVAQRAFTPEEYLPTGTSADRMMAPRQRANAEVAIVDPGADAVGFQSHPCLRQSGGIVCADDALFVK